MQERNPRPVSEDASRDRREHGGAPAHLDDDALARRTERERVDAGVDAYSPDDVPPATDEPVPTDLTGSESYRAEVTEARREEREGDLYPLTEQRPFPPSHYKRT